MKAIEVTIEDGARVVINLDKIIYFEELKHSETKIFFTKDHFVIARAPLENIIEILKQSK